MSLPAAPAPSATPDTARIAIDLSGCETKADLLARIARAMHFPSWFGHNWDALSDCLADLSWLPASGYAIELQQTQDLRRSAPDVLDTLLEIFDDSAAFWADAGIGFQVVQLDEGGDAIGDSEPATRE
jgi:RNAse (barnase) inhibitor barstar